MQLLALTLSLFVCSTVLADGYLFATFKGEQTPMTEQIYFVVSQDGRDWQELNGGKPVLVSGIGEKGVRDPFLVRTHDGKFVVIATDLSVHLLHNNWKKAVTAGSRSVVIWESDDLVKWSAPRLVQVAADDAGCTWAPEAVYDEDADDYLVFWASTNAADGFKKHRIWAARTKDFKSFDKPFVYIDKDHAVIDTTIVRENGRYYRFSKDEKQSAITMEQSEKLLGPWHDVPSFSLASMKGYEGPECYPLTPPAEGKPATWCLVLDHFSRGDGYKPWVTHDLSRGTFEPGPGFVFPFKLRHGAILPVTTDEMAKLRAAYK